MAEIENLKIGSGGTIHIVGNEDIVAEAWAAGQSYVKDKSYVINNHVLYVCNTSHTSVSPFDPANWTQITVGESLGDMLSAIPASASDLPYAAGVSTADAIGVLSSLDTSTQTSLVAAINELVATSKLNPVYGNTASGAIATFDTSLALPLQDLQIAINAVQESGTPTPSSPKAITGFTGANIIQAPIYERVIATTPSTQTSDGITITTKANGLIEVNGTASSNGTITFDCNPFVIPSIDGRTMRLNNSFTGGFTVRFFNGSTEIDYWALNTINRTVSNYAGMGGQTVTRIAIAYSSGASVTSGTLLVDFIANSTTTAITWQSEAGTVYGGSLDVTSGVLTVTHGIVDLGDLSWTYDSAYTRFASSISGGKSYGTAVRTAPFICSCYQTISDGRPLAQVPNDSIYNGNSNSVYVKTANYTDAGQFTTAVTGEKLVYELATPVTYQLTPTQISAIVGTNNIFTDTNGNTSVVYACSLKDYIEGQ